MRFSMPLALLAGASLGLAPAMLAQINPAQPAVRPGQVAPIQPPARTCPAATRDCDGDGSEAIRVGGRDCDDTDATRYPEAIEIANGGKDEDCDPRTFGGRDMDDDGELDSKDYNTDPSGKRYGGTDCDDTRKAIRSSAQELPNKIDDDCDGAVDNLLGDWFTPKS